MWGEDDCLCMYTYCNQEVTIYSCPVLSAYSEYDNIYIISARYNDDTVIPVLLGNKT